MAIDLSAPAFMRQAAKRGLKLYEEGEGGDGLVPATISSARKMANGDVTIEKWRKIGPWIARHLVDLDAPKNNDPSDSGYPGAGLVAHLLWGSGPSKQDAERAMNYAIRLVDRFDKESERALTLTDADMGETSMEEDQVEVEPAVNPSMLIDSLRELLSDTVSFYFQAHGSHWNVRGQDFSQYHDLFGDIYEDAYSAIDPTAENIRKLGGEAPFLLQDFVNLSSVRQMSMGNSTSELATELLQANEQILMCLRNTFEVAEELDEQGICNFLADRIDQHQKWGWQLRASLDPIATRSSTIEWVTRSVDDKRSVAFSNLEVRASGEGNTLVGYAALWDTPSLDMGFTEYVTRGAFTKTLKDGADVRLLFDHEGAPLARTKSGTLRLSEDHRGLKVEAELDPANPLAQSVMSALRRGDLNQMSFAFRTIKDSWSKDRSVRELREVQLFDVSVVTYPAYEETVAELRGMQYTPPVVPTRLRRQQIALTRIK
jgi:HK97 family phage prohead protease